MPMMVKSVFEVVRILKETTRGPSPKIVGPILALKAGESVLPSKITAPMLSNIGGLPGIELVKGF
jgi:hypothetical protein